MFGQPKLTADVLTERPLVFSVGLPVELACASLGGRLDQGERQVRDWWQHRDIRRYGDRLEQESPRTG